MRSFLTISFLVALAAFASAHTCSITGTSADCSGRSLTAVPQDLPTDITLLNLSGNLFTTVPAGAFSNYPAVTGIAFSGNTGVLSFSPAAFAGLPALIAVDVTGANVPKTPPGLFYGVPIVNAQGFTSFASAEDAGGFFNNAGTYSPCHQSCSSSCTGPSDTDCCDSSCATCSLASDPTSCTSCFSFASLTGSTCVTSIPNNVANVDDPQLNTKYPAGFFSGFTSCWVKSASSYVSGYAVDDKYCCRRLGKISSNFCLTGCAPSYDSYGAYAYVGSNDFDGKICLASCIALP